MDTFPQALRSRVPQQCRAESRPEARGGAEVEFEAEVASVSDRIRELRARGLTPKQIREELPGVSPWVVNCAINRDATAQASHPGLRARARDADRERARTLRLQGRTYKQIQAELDVSASTLSMWLRDLPHPELDRAAHAAHMHRVLATRRGEQREEQKAAAFAEVDEISDRELLLLGVALYWAEGVKDKPYSRREYIQFINSDAGMIGLFLRWLDLVGVEEADRQYRISIHESADLVAAEDFWRRVVGKAEADFRKATLKRHKIKTVRKQLNDDYHGCLVVWVRKSSGLYRRVDGWWRGILAARGAGGMPN